jgi:hypothetical protein
MKQCRPPLLTTVAAAVHACASSSIYVSQETVKKMQHDGGDRNEYLQEMEHSDPEFYVPTGSEANSLRNATLE